MNDKIIKEALSYDLGSDLHEVWRLTRRKADGTFEPRIKKSKDEAWNVSHGTDEVDIANCSFEELPLNWQYENLETARVEIGLVYDRTIASEPITSEELEKMGATVHDEWLKRNSWVYDSNWGNPKLAVPYEQLSALEQDKVQIISAEIKVQSYVNGLIDIETLCEKYGIKSSGKKL